MMMSMVVMTMMFLYLKKEAQSDCLWIPEAFCLLLSCLGKFKTHVCSGERERERGCFTSVQCSFGVMESSRTRQWLQSSVNGLNATELCTLNNG